MRVEYYCKNCNGTWDSFPDSDSDSECEHWSLQSKVVFSRRERFVEWFFKLDIIGILAFTGAAIINGLLLSHSPLSDYERILESVCMGIVLVRILEK